MPRAVVPAINRGVVKLLVLRPGALQPMHTQFSWSGVNNTDMRRQQQQLHPGSTLCGACGRPGVGPMDVAMSSQQNSEHCIRRAPAAGTRWPQAVAGAMHPASSRASLSQITSIACLEAFLRAEGRKVLLQAQLQAAWALHGGRFLAGCTQPGTCGVLLCCSHGECQEGRPRLRHCWSQIGRWGFMRWIFAYCATQSKAV